MIFSEDTECAGIIRSYCEHLEFLAEQYSNDIMINTYPSSNCASCEFSAPEQEIEKGLRSGFHECWYRAFGWNENDFREQNVLNIWNFRKKDRFIQEGLIKLSAIAPFKTGAGSL